MPAKRPDSLLRESRCEETKSEPEASGSLSSNTGQSGGTQSLTADDVEPLLDSELYSDEGSI